MYKRCWERCVACVRERTVTSAMGLGNWKVSFCFGLIFPSLRCHFSHHHFRESLGPAEQVFLQQCQRRCEGRWWNCIPALSEPWGWRKGRGKKFIVAVQGSSFCLGDGIPPTLEFCLHLFLLAPASYFSRLASRVTLRPDALKLTRPGLSIWAQERANVMLFSPGYSLSLYGQWP